MTISAKGLITTINMAGIVIDVITIGESTKPTHPTIFHCYTKSRVCIQLNLLTIRLPVSLPLRWD